MSRVTAVDPAYSSHAAHLVGGSNKPAVIKCLSRPAPSSEVAARGTGGAAAAGATARLLARARAPLSQQPASKGVDSPLSTTQPAAQAGAPRETLSSTFRHDAAELLKLEGNVACKNRKWELAEKCYSEAIEKDPSYAALFSNRALARQKQNKMLLALQDAEQCVELMPQWDRGWARKAEILLECQDFVAALDAASRAVTLLSHGNTAASTKEHRKRVRGYSSLLQRAGDGARQEQLQATSAAANAPLPVSEAHDAPALPLPSFGQGDQRAPTIPQETMRP